MLSDTSNLIKIFEKEVWLYLNQELDNNRMQFWNEQISKSPEFKVVLNESQQIMNIYNSKTLADIEDPVYNNMLSLATKPRFFEKLKNIITPANEHGVAIHKIALAVTLFIAALVMLFLSDKPNQVKLISNELLEWNSVSLTEQMNNIETGISLIDQDNYKRYLILKLKDENWNRNIYSIGKDLEKMKKELDEISM